MRKLALGALGCLVTSLLLAQSSPFVPEKTERLLVNELSGDLAFETLRITTQWHKPSGSEGFFAVAHYVEEKAKAAGSSDVRWIDQVAETPSWTCQRAEAWTLEGEGATAKETLIGSYAEVATSIADNSRPADVTAELVDVGAGTRRVGLRGQGRARQDRPRLRIARVRDGAGRLEARRRGNPRLVLDAVEPARRRARPDRLAERPRRGRPPRREDDLRVHPPGPRGQGSLGPAPRPGLRPLGKLRSQGFGPAARAHRRRVVGPSPRRRPRWSKRGSRGPTPRCPRSCSPATSRRRSSRPTTTSPASRACSRSDARSRA